MRKYEMLLLGKSEPITVCADDMQIDHDWLVFLVREARDTTIVTAAFRWDQMVSVTSEEITP